MTIRRTRTGRPAAAGAILLLSFAAFLGCRAPESPRSLSELRDALKWTDAATQNAIVPIATADELRQTGAWVRESRRPDPPYPKKSVLVLSGGGAYGAYCAGFLNGWTQSGTRPEFDVVTGVSTGAMIGVLAFIGPEYDDELRRLTTSLRTEDVYKRRRILQSLLGESLALNDPLAKLIEQASPPDRLRKVAAEHAKGRRLYVGTTELETRRQVIWDMGQIASRGTPEAYDLFRRLILASGAIPAFFPPVRIPVTVDGVETVERHIDGGVSSSMFFVPPPAPHPDPPAGWLHDSDLYALVAGKLYADPARVRLRTLAVAGNSISSIIYDQTRSDLHKLFLMSMLTGMNYHFAAIPQSAAMPMESTEFDPAELALLYGVGEKQGRSEGRWRDTPPGGYAGERPLYRGTTVLTGGGTVGPRSRRGLFGWPAGTVGGPLPRIPMGQQPVAK